MMARRDLQQYYRQHDDFRRYLHTSEKRAKELSDLYRSNRRFFGKRVLDLACGGGILGFLVETKGHEYVGIDANPDVVKSAIGHARRAKSSNRFLLGDIRSAKISGVFDTITLLGNALTHFNIEDFVATISNLSKNVRIGSYLIVDYRDVVSMLFQRRWKRRFTGKRGGHLPGITTATRDINPLLGELLMESMKQGRRKLKFRFGVWSPFIVEALMRLMGWRLVRRSYKNSSNISLEVYRKF